jgi:hypothetical protein
MGNPTQKMCMTTPITNSCKESGYFYGTRKVHHDAIHEECGDSFACFWFEHASNDVLEDMKKDLKSKWIVTTRCYLTVVLRSFIHCSRAREGGPPRSPAALWAFQQQKTILSYGSL